MRPELESYAALYSPTCLAESLMRTPALPLRNDPCADADFCHKKFRDRATGLCSFHGRVKLGFIRTRYLCNQVEMALRARKSIRQFLQRNRCSGFQLARSHARIAQLCR